MMVALLASSTFASAEVVRWSDIAGVITAPGVDNPVAVISDDTGNVVSSIHSGTLPWSVRQGNARVDLNSGAVSFGVTGLVLIGGNATGTAGPINQVTGTLVCNAGSSATDSPQAVLDTPPVELGAFGDAQFSGQLVGQVPSPCKAPQFLIRIGPAFGDFAGRWLATGVEPRPGQSVIDNLPARRLGIR